MNEADKMKKDFIEDYSPHQRHEPMYPVELNENKVFRVRLNQLLEQYAQQVAVEFADYAQREVDKGTWQTTDELFKEFSKHQNQEDERKNFIQNRP